MLTHLKEAVIKGSLILLMVFGIGLLSLLQSCDSKDPEPENEEELITTVNITLVPVESGDTVIFTFDDPDGVGGQSPVITGGTLMAGSTYNGIVELLNKSVSPALNITEEIKQEDDQHIFCYGVSGTDISITRTDTDGTYEVGIETQWVCGNTGSGEVTVILKHQPDGLKDGTCDSGDTDIEVTFPVVVQ